MAERRLFLCLLLWCSVAGAAMLPQKACRFLDEVNIRTDKWSVGSLVKDVYSCRSPYGTFGKANPKNEIQYAVFGSKDAVKKLRLALYVNNRDKNDLREVSHFFVALSSILTMKAAGAIPGRALIDKIYRMEPFSVTFRGKRLRLTVERDIGPVTYFYTIE